MLDSVLVYYVVLGLVCVVMLKVKSFNPSLNEWVKVQAIT